MYACYQGSDPSKLRDVIIHCGGLPIACCLLPAACYLSLTFKYRYYSTKPHVRMLLCVDGSHFTLLRPILPKSQQHLQSFQVKSHDIKNMMHCSVLYCIALYLLVNYYNAHTDFLNSVLFTTLLRHDVQ